LAGTIEKIVSDNVVPEVLIRTAAGNVTSIITTGLVERMNLKQGDSVLRLLRRPKSPLKRNRFPHQRFEAVGAVRCLKPRLGKAAKIWKKIAGSVDKHDGEEIFCPRPDDTKSESTYCQDDDRVGNSIERARI
jgi:molybdopterin-binding protein